MPMPNNTARDSFFEEVGRVIEQEDIYIVSVDLAGKPFDSIKERYPARFVPVGIAEQDSVAVSVGLALAGKRVIIYVFNPFLALRALDQIRNGICMNLLPITITAYGTGFSADGPTHYVTEDVALIKQCPGIKQVTVSDCDMAHAAFSHMIDHRNAMYLRFDRACNDPLNREAQINFDRGFRVLVPSSGSVAVISEGYPLHGIMAEYDGDESTPEIIEVFTHPFDQAALLEEIKGKSRIVVCEEQQIHGGLGSDILEMLSDAHVYIDVTRLGIDYQGQFPEEFGSRDYLMKRFKIDGRSVRAAVNRA